MSADGVCDQWCLNNHSGVQCSAEYTARDLAKDRGMGKACQLMDEIDNGRWCPGDGQTSVSGRNVSPAKSTGKSEKAVLSSELIPSITEATKARNKVDAFGMDQISKNGNTILHETVSICDNPAMVHICAQSKFNMNLQNFDGDTPLHISAQRGHLLAARALLMNGADITQRNKLGQTPLDQSSGVLKNLLESYKLGIVSALTKGSKAAMQSIMRLWPNPNAIIKPGMSALEYAKANCCKGASYQSCYNLLKDSQPTMRLVHAVLSEDISSLKALLKTDSTWNVNVRYKDKFGESPLSCAIEQHNLEIVQLLMETGKCTTNLRIRQNSVGEETVPLYFKTLESQCPEDIWKYVFNNSTGLNLTERDSYGNTGLHYAIAAGKSPKFIQMMLMASGGHDITCRNAEGLNTRELAMSLDRQDIVDTIDKFLCEHPKFFLMNLPVAFYGQENLQISAEGGLSLLDAALAKGSEQDVMAIRQYKKIENLGRKLFAAVQAGDYKKAAVLNTANYQDTNGYTALIYAIAYNQPRVAEILITSRPPLCGLPDNCGRLPLHYAYALPEDQGEAFIKLLVGRGGPWANTEHCMDKDGCEPAEYRAIRSSQEIVDMLEAVRTVDSIIQRTESEASQPSEQGG